MKIRPLLSLVSCRMPRLAGSEISIGMRVWNGPAVRYEDPIALKIPLHSKNVNAVQNFSK